MVWQKEDLRTRLDEVLTHAREEGPQVIEVEDGARYVLLGEEPEEPDARPAFNLKEWLLNLPKVEGFEIPRDKDLDRESPFA
jgi:hypothetical protein